MVNYLHITPEAGMVMKKAFGDDSPLWQGARKSFRSPRARDEDDGGCGLVSRNFALSLGFLPRDE